MNRSIYDNPISLLPKLKLSRRWLFGTLIVSALLAFEIFNFSTTDYSLGDLLGDLSFIQLKWSTILAIAFCGIDFAGLARLFTPEIDQDEPKEIWYLFGAWLLAATMNAVLTWWGVSVAIISHTPSHNALIDRETLLTIVPVFVAVMVWLIRILIIGTFSVAGDRLLHEPRSTRNSGNHQRTNHVAQTSPQPQTRQANSPRPIPTVNPAGRPSQPVFRPAARNATQNQMPNRPEPTYVPLSIAAAGRNDDDFHVIP